MAAFKFKEKNGCFQVYVGSKMIGELIATKEASGRHCFYLGCDDRAEPRTYRGKIRAAEALHVIFKLATESRKKRWSVERLLIAAWDERPRASDAAN